MFHLRGFDLRDVFHEDNPGVKRDLPVLSRYFRLQSKQDYSVLIGFATAEARLPML